MFLRSYISSWLERSAPDPSQTPRRGGSLFYPAVTLIILFLLVPPALLRPLQMSDEGRYAEVSREVLVSGDWIVPHMNGVPHLTKSAFYYDLVAISYKFLGIHLFSQRLVSIIPFLLSLLFTIRWADRRGGRGAALLCAMISLTMVHPVAAGQFGDLNMLLTAFLTVGLLLVFDGLAAPDRLAAWMLGWAMIGLAFLTKGPPALMIPVGALLVYRWISGRPFGKPLSWWLGGCLVFSLCGFSWYLWLLLTQGQMLWNFWMTDIVQRTSMNKVKTPLYYYFFYLGVFLVCSSGWGVWMAWRYYQAARWRRAAGHLSWPRASLRAMRSLPAPEQWLLSWLVATILIFSALRAHMITYLQPAYPAAALLLALYCLRQRRQPGLARVLTWLTGFAALVTILVLWGLSLFQFTMINRESPKAMSNETVEFNVLARRMMSSPRQDWTLVLCDFYNPSFCFLSQRLATLCDQEVHPGWPLPDQLKVDRIDLRRRMASSEPLMVLLKKNKIPTYFPDPIPAMRELARGHTYVLLSNVPEK